MAQNYTTWHGYIVFSRHGFHKYDKYNLFNHSGFVLNRPSPETIHIIWDRWRAGEIMRMFGYRWKGVDLKWNDYIKHNMEINYSLLKEKGNCRFKVWIINVEGEILIYRDTMGQYVCNWEWCMWSRLGGGFYFYWSERSGEEDKYNCTIQLFDGIAQVATCIYR